MNSDICLNARNTIHSNAEAHARHYHCTIKGPMATPYIPANSWLLLPQWRGSVTAIVLNGAPSARRHGASFSFCAPSLSHAYSATRISMLSRCSRLVAIASSNSRVDLRHLRIFHCDLQLRWGFQWWVKGDWRWGCFSASCMHMAAAARYPNSGQALGHDVTFKHTYI